MAKIVADGFAEVARDRVDMKKGIAILKQGVIEVKADIALISCVQQLQESLKILKAMTKNCYLMRFY